MQLPTLHHRKLVLRGVRMRDARAMEQALGENRAWLSPWEATHPLIRPGDLWSWQMNPESGPRTQVRAARGHPAWLGQGCPPPILSAYPLLRPGQPPGQTSISIFDGAPEP